MNYYLKTEIKKIVDFQKLKIIYFSLYFIKLFLNLNILALWNMLFQLFEDDKMIEKIRRKLPYMFFIAEIEMSKSGKVGMEVGTLREQILIALLIYKFGYENVKLNPIANENFDLELYGKPVSIKTIKKILPKRIKKFSGSGIKLVWTVDWEKVENFYRNYEPRSEIILVEVSWYKNGGLYYIPLEVQREIFEEIGRDRYLYRHKKGTNPRGVEISNEGIKMLIEHPQAKKIDIFWEKPEIGADIIYKPYQRWVELWAEE
ncbi:MAG: ThaI family type II restriction endonuclease [Candidatus Hydrothermia bacterium]|nr:ThaI family type II restriction endonuclease [Candidatus Hydrothermia bacterium]